MATDDVYLALGEKLRDALDQLLPNLLWNQPVEPYEGNRGTDGVRVRRLVELTALGPGTLEPDLAEIASRSCRSFVPVGSPRRPSARLRRRGSGS